MSARIVNVDPVADAAFEQLLADLTASNPSLMGDDPLTLPQPMFREVLRTTFYLGWAGGENNALNKIRHE